MILRDVPGLADPHIQPPQVAEVGDPFADLRVVHLLARAPRGVPLRLRDLVDQLNAEYRDWSFSRPVVMAAIMQLQSNWLSDYRNSDGIAFAEDATGPTVRVEDTTRVDPWITRQVARLHDECEVRLRAFAIVEGALP